VCRTREFLATLFESHIRPLLDYCSSVCNLGYRGDLNGKTVQCKWSKEVVGTDGMDYPARLKHLSLFSDEGRILRTDLIKIWKVFHVEINVGLFVVFDMSAHESTRGHSFKLAILRCWKETKRLSFNVR